MPLFFIGGSSFLLLMVSLLSVLKIYRSEPVFVFVSFSLLYIFLAWVVCGEGNWWVIDYVDSSNVFYGDDAYRFFLARSAWINPDLYSYNFVLPGFLLLDGTVVSVAKGDLFYARCIHGLLASFCLALLWQSGRTIGINRGVMTSAVVLMGMLPRFALTSLSFYGEAWLLFLICFLIFLYLRERYFIVSILASLMPLVRPEGMFFWLPLWFSLLLKRKWLEAAVMLLPGVVYFAYLNVIFSDLSQYGYWRLELRKILNKLVLNESAMEWINTYSLLLVLPSTLGWLYKPVRHLWPFLLGGFAWFSWLVLLFWCGLSDYEDRYTFILIPLMVLLWASFFTWLKNVVSGFSQQERWVSRSVVICATAVVVMHFSNMYMLKGSVKYIGGFATLKNVLAGRWEKIFLSHSEETVEEWKAAALKIESMLSADPGIDRLIVFDHVFYYHLDPYNIPEQVTVAYATNGYRVFHILFDGQVFAQHPGEEMYSYFDFSEPKYSSSEKRAIYVDLMPLKGYPYTWRFAGYQVHLFAYARSLSSRKKIEDAPTIDLELMKKAYDKWW
ncbi:hypothetical protein Q670_07350 [Alcanivorax sp. P2S70]|uniref:hypothetical protein n=1 Tax=Alcanivorax sp. P2S70 TaxID=1397527 RepID=UPI0003B7918E|nr:hypothetical protein [Alcanivorax sp. P2S70]ERP93188.1 hypothetical protein Q670_07350 [Alcanivorax sp. P2S70]